jgi:hypothetical protein
MNRTKLTQWTWYIFAQSCSRHNPVVLCDARELLQGSAAHERCGAQENLLLRSGHAGTDLAKSGKLRAGPPDP